MCVCVSVYVCESVCVCICRGVVAMPVFMCLHVRRCVVCECVSECVSVSE